MKEKEKELNNNNNNYENEDLEIIMPPYYRVMYVDDCGYKHLATVQDTHYLAFLKDRFIILECKFIIA